MSAPKPSSIGTVNPAEESEVGGTSFLDLPLELREMIYDLCAPKSTRMRFYTVPFQSKPVVTGITLLRCSKQIYNEVYQRLKLNDSTWTLEVPPPSLAVASRIDVDCSLTKHGLHDLALAKIRWFVLRFKLTTNSPTSFCVMGLESLLKLKSIWSLAVELDLDPGLEGSVHKPWCNSENMPFLIGFVICVLSYIPRSVSHITWYLWDSGRASGRRRNDDLTFLAEKYKFVKGSAYR